MYYLKGATLSTGQTTALSKIIVARLDEEWLGNVRLGKIKDDSLTGARRSVTVCLGMRRFDDLLSEISVTVISRSDGCSTRWRQSVARVWLD